MTAVAGAELSYLRVAAALAVAIAALATLLPYEPVFDAWAWLVWGRELGDLELDTSAGASWKPGPVLLTAPLSLLGEAAPQAWLFIARVGWLLAPALAARLAWRLALGAGCDRSGGLAAGAIAGVSVLLLEDGFTPWLRQAAGGLGEPLLISLVLGAVEAHLARRAGLAFGLLVAASILRPEAWPFLAGYAVLHGRAGGSRAAIALGLAAVPALWLIPDLVGSGSVLSGAERARADGEGPLVNGLEALWRSFNLAPAALPAATTALVLVMPGSARASSGVAGIRALAGLAAAWAAVVVVMATFGYAGLPRFAAPAGAMLCVTGGAAVAVLLRSPVRRRRVIALACLAGLVIQGGVRAAQLPGDAAVAARQSAELVELRELLADLGPGAAASCGEVSTSDLLTQAALAWELERDLAGVSLRRDSIPPQGLALVGPNALAGAVRGAQALGEPVARRGAWSAYAISCNSAGASRSATAGLGGRR